MFTFLAGVGDDEMYPLNTPSHLTVASDGVEKYLVAMMIKGLPPLAVELLFLQSCDHMFAFVCVCLRMHAYACVCMRMQTQPFYNFTTKFTLALTNGKPTTMIELIDHATTHMDIN